MSVELIAIAAGIIITWLLFIATLKVLKISITTALGIGAILLLTQIIFGITYQQIWLEIQQLVQRFLVN